jgi:hypothetical protein
MEKAPGKAGRPSSQGANLTTHEEKRREGCGKPPECASQTLDYEEGVMDPGLKIWHFDIHCDCVCRSHFPRLTPANGQVQQVLRPSHRSFL